MPPNVAFDYDSDADNGQLAIAVTGGDSFTAGQVEIQGNKTYGHAGNTWDEYAPDKGP